MLKLGVLGRFRLVALSLLFAHVALIGCGTGSQGQEEAAGGGETIKLGIATVGYPYSPIYVAAAEKFWEKKGLNVEFTEFQSGTQLIQAFTADAIDIAVNGPADLITLAAANTKAQTFMFVQNNLLFELYAKSPDLEGRSVAVSGIGAFSQIITAQALAAAGTDVSKVKFSAAGPPSARLAALKNGAADAAVLNPPDTVAAKEAGFLNVLNFGQALPNYPQNIFYAKTEYLENNKELVSRFVDGYRDALKFYFDPSNTETVVDVIAQKLSVPPEDAANAYEVWLSVIASAPAPDESSIQLAIDGMRKYSTVTVADSLTAKDLVNSGF